MNTFLYFVRHADSTYTPDEWNRPLSDQGINDASLVVERLKLENVDYIVSSPYKRAIQTVEGLAVLLDCEIQIINEFKERKIADKPVVDFNKTIKKLWSDQEYSIHGGESNQNAQERGVKATIKVLQQYKGKNIVIATHGNLMVLIMNYFNKRYDYEFWQKLSMPDIYRLTFEGTELKEVNRLWSNNYS
ncbi:histidine phosphatase family protein [Aquibacillus halophilus]|uniref:Histidine phosphatase family protein n=1 Tax=Aquibacillus halophilus TaxID=930132 RepID=A0A6A8D881_9BACI|nr:histidine phosphatase family protein [Aquibacillus halophilus]MRH41798.1 histidine phosphatase family protein [Aquibacillus halophilus]